MTQRWARSLDNVAPFSVMQWTRVFGRAPSPWYMRCPEMVSVVFHQGFRFKNPALIEHVLSLESDEFPAWDTLSDSITLEPWAQQLANELCKEPMGEWLLTVAAGLEYLFAKPERASAKDHSEDDAEDSDKDADSSMDGEDEEEKDARAREEAGQDWMVEQGFDRKD